jgi:hypothetical protein
VPLAGANMMPYRKIRDVDSAIKLSALHGADERGAAGNEPKEGMA